MSARQDSLQDAINWLDDRRDAVMDEQIRICEIAAPTGAESQRAAYIADAMSAAGLSVSHDHIGNVYGLRQGRNPSSDSGAIVLSAHLDTVFTAQQPVDVARPGQADPYRSGATVPADRYHAPGISDAAAGLAATLAVARALQHANPDTQTDILFLATVGEEGRGDLRGARAFFDSPAGRRARAFITVDHSEPAVIVHRAIGSRRYRALLNGRGGHSWAHFGRYNPVFAAAAAIDQLAQTSLPDRPRTTFNVGPMQGGATVNAIPESASFEVDLRSESPDALNDLDRAFQAAVATGHQRETGQRPDGAQPPQIEPIGDRPAGETPADSTLVRAASAALREEHLQPRLVGASTDANAGIAASVPSIAMSWGGRSDEQHSIREWFSPHGRQRSLRVLLRLILQLAQPID